MVKPALLGAAPAPLGAVLDQIASGAGGKNFDAETGQLAIPDEDGFVLGRFVFDNRLGQFGHGDQRLGGGCYEMTLSEPFLK